MLSLNHRRFNQLVRLDGFITLRGECLQPPVDLAGGGHAKAANKMNVDRIFL
jgi:hypothetical protein